MLRKDSWERWDVSALEIFTMALRELITIGTLPENEDEVSRCLYLALKKCETEWFERNPQRLQGHLFFQAPIQPNPKDNCKQPCENKIPDFTWQFTDCTNENKYYIVECKRLGEDKYHFCREYVSNGMNRFVLKEWSYGRGCESALMIGYVQSMELNDILKWVNHYAQKNTMNPLELNGEWGTQDVSRLENELERPQISKNHLRLVHLWVDLR